MLGYFGVGYCEWVSADLAPGHQKGPGPSVLPEAHRPRIVRVVLWRGTCSCRSQKSGICSFFAFSRLRFCAARWDSGFEGREVDFPLVRFGFISTVLTLGLASAVRFVALAFEVALLAAFLPFLLRFLEVDRLYFRMV